MLNTSSTTSPSHRWHLLYQMLMRDIAQRYRGSLLGVLWAFITPLLLLGVYTFVFTVVFPARWGTSGANEGQPLVHFALLLFSGLILHSFMSEVITRAPSLMLSHVNLVKKVIFPLEVLPLISMGNALFHLLIGYGILAIAQLIITGSLNTGWLLLPIILLPFILLLLGCAWTLAALGVFIRDIGQILGLTMTILLFLSPIFYPVSALPEPFQFWIYLNPLTLVIEATRAAIFDQGTIMWFYLQLYGAVGLLAAYIGYWIFQRSRGSFADIL